MTDPAPEEVRDLVDGMLERLARETADERLDRTLRLVERYFPEDEREEGRALAHTAWAQETGGLQ